MVWYYIINMDIVNRLEQLAQPVPKLNSLSILVKRLDTCSEEQRNLIANGVRKVVKLYVEQQVFKNTKQRKDISFILGQLDKLIPKVSRTSVGFKAAAFIINQQQRSKYFRVLAKNIRDFGFISQYVDLLYLVSREFQSQKLLQQLPTIDQIKEQLFFTQSKLAAAYTTRYKQLFQTMLIKRLESESKEIKMNQLKTMNNPHRVAQLLYTRLKDQGNPLEMKVGCLKGLIVLIQGFNFDLPAFYDELASLLQTNNFAFLQLENCQTLLKLTEISLRSSKIGRELIAKIVGILAQAANMGSLSFCNWFIDLLFNCIKRSREVADEVGQSIGKLANHYDVTVREKAKEVRNTIGQDYKDLAYRGYSLFYSQKLAALKKRVKQNRVVVELNLESLCSI